MFHAGGYAFGSVSLLSDAANLARSVGLRPVLVDYTLGDPAAALRDAKRAVRAESRGGRRVVAYGESAGGGIALRLAQLGMVREAAAISPVIDLQKYAVASIADPKTRRQILGTRREQRQLSPALHRSLNPMYASYGHDELTDANFGVLASEVRLWLSDDPLAVGGEVAGGHMGLPGAYPRVSNRAICWLVKGRRAQPAACS
jgi:acetyl esterase/lipase